MKRLLFLLTSIIALSSCYNDKEALLYPSPACDTTNVRFNYTIKPIIDNSCALAGCHNANAQSGGYNLSSYAGVLSAAQNGSLIGSITHASGYAPMPRNAQPLPDCEISQIKAWVNMGSPNN